MEAKVMKVTPEQAMAWLKKTNTMNRKMSPNTVNAYARDMRRGAWKFGYDPIVINVDGQLENGQHRLMAVVKSKIPTEFYVITNAKGSMETYDRGRPRSIRDALTIRLQKDGKEVTNILVKSAMARYILCEGLNFYKPSDDTIYNLLCDYDETMSTATSLVGTSHKIVRKACVLVAVFCALRSGISEQVIHDFFEVVKTGFMAEPWQTSAVVYRQMLDERSLNSVYDKKWAEALTEMALRDFDKQNARKKKYSVDLKHATFFNDFCEKVKKERDYL